MSQKEIEQLFAKAGTDPALFEQLMAGEDADAIVQIGKDNGFQFTSDELNAAYPRFRPRGLARQERDAQKLQAAALVNARPASETDVGPNGGGGGGEVPLPSLADIMLRSFTVSPSTIRPRSGGADINWVVDYPAGLGATFLINDVPQTGRSMHDDPVATEVYWLTAYKLGKTRFLGSVKLTVDNTGCEQERVAQLGVIEAMGRYNLYNTQKFKDGVSYESAGFTAVARMNDMHDFTTVEDGGMILVTIRLGVTLIGIDGGSFTSKAWIRPFAHHGAIAHFVDRSDTDYSLPGQVWALAVLGGPTWLAVWGGFQELISQKINPGITEAINTGFSLIDALFNNVISVVVDSEIPDVRSAQLRAVVRDPACG